SRLQAAHRHARRIQREVHGEPDGAARRLLRDAAIAGARDVPQFLHAAIALAVQRAAARALARVTQSRKPRRGLTMRLRVVAFMLTSVLFVPAALAQPAEHAADQEKVTLSDRDADFLAAAASIGLAEID